jgi:hypothetical protein
VGPLGRLLWAHDSYRRWRKMNALMRKRPYAYQQVSDDTGGSPLLGGFRSRFLGVGPQIAYLFPVGGMQGSRLMGNSMRRTGHRLEYVVDVCDFAGCSHRRDANPAPGDEVND